MASLYLQERRTYWPILSSCVMGGAEWKAVSISLGVLMESEKSFFLVKEWVPRMLGRY